MKKSVIFFAVIFSLFAVSCDNEEEVEPEEKFTSSHHHLVVYTDDENIDFCVFTVHCEPQIESLSERMMIKEQGKFEFNFALSLETYGEDQTVKVSILATNCNERPCKVYEDYQYVPIEGNDIDNPNEIIFEVGD